MIRSFLCVVLLCLLLPIRATAGQVEAVSVPATPSSSATAAGALPEYSSAVSNDGRWITFWSLATDLVPGQVDSGAFSKVFLRDRATRTTLLVSHTMAGANVAAPGGYPLISADGGVVAFFSSSGDLVPGETNPGNFPRLHLYERSTGRIQVVTPPNGYVYRFNVGCDLSADGRWVVYSMSPNPATPEPQHIYLFDRSTGQSTLVDRSAASPGQPSNGSSLLPRISSDGRYVAFSSSSSDVVADQRGPGAFLYDRIENKTVRVTDASVQELRLSDDGRWLAFLSPDPLVIPGQFDRNGSGLDIFLWDRVSGGVILVSRSQWSPLATGNKAASWSYQQAGSETYFSESVISADGRWVAFFSAADDLAGEAVDTNSMDVFLFDRETGATTRVSRTAGTIFLTAPWALALSDDGGRVAYVSPARTEVPGQIDNPGSLDMFVFDRITGNREIASRSMSSALTATEFTSPRAQISGDGRVVVFESQSQDLVANDQSSSANVFAYVLTGAGQLFHPLPPCRLLDTRQTGTALFSEIPRTVTVTGFCDVPITARSVAATVTVVQPLRMGRLLMQPGDVSSETSSVNFATGETRANHASVGLAFDGTGTLSLTPHIPGGGTMHVILDVSGYYE